MIYLCKSFSLDNSSQINGAFPVSETKQKIPCGRITVICIEAINKQTKEVKTVKDGTREKESQASVRKLADVGNIDC